MKTGPTVPCAGALHVRAIALLGLAALAGTMFVGTQEIAHAANSPPTIGAGQLFGVHPLQQGRTTLPGGHFNFALIPGQRITDGIVIENFTGSALRFHVYGADLLTAVGGGLAPAQPNAVMHGVGGWITIGTPAVTVPAHGRFTDKFTLTVPLEASSGQHLGTVVAAADVGTTSVGNPIEARVALIAVVTVPGVAHASATLTALTGSVVASGQIGFRVSLVNTGNVLLTYAGSLEIDSSAGHRLASLMLTPTGGYVVPDGRVPMLSLWDDASIGAGTYRAHATIDILADGIVVGTLSSQVLQLELRSTTPMLAWVAGLGIVVILALIAWTARRVIRRRIRWNRTGIAVKKLSGVP